MQTENIAENKHLKKNPFWGQILLCEDKIEIRLYGADNWVDDLVAALKRFGIKTDERFRSPCG